jgi:dUTPase
VNEGDRIAQLILERISHARVNQVEVRSFYPNHQTHILNDGEHGAGSFKE